MFIFFLKSGVIGFKLNKRSKNFFEKENEEMERKEGKK